MSNNQINIVEFSIAGVTGFKTAVVTVEGALLSNKRIAAAFNQMRAIMRRMGLAESVELADSVSKAHMSNLNNEDRIFNAIKVVSSVTTHEYFDLARTLFEGNINLFESSRSEICAGLESYLDRNKPQLIAPSDESYTARAYICTGGLFGDTPYVILLSDTMVRVRGNGNALEAIRKTIHQALEVVKNWKLGNYTMGCILEPMHEAAKDIETLDRFFDELSQVNIIQSTTLVSSSSANSEPNSVMQSEATRKAIMVMEDGSFKSLLFHVEVSLK